MTGNTHSSKPFGLIITIIFLIVGIALLEITSSFLLDRNSLGAKKKILEAMLATRPLTPLEINHVNNSKISPHPYLLYQNTPNYIRVATDGTQAPEHNALGYRSDEFTLEKPANVFRILVLGGSTTYGAAMSNYQDTWPHLMQNILNQNLASEYERIEVINAGLSGATSAELLSGWIFRHQYLKPDLLMIHTGGNDMNPLLYPDYNPEYTHFRARGGSYRMPFREVIIFLVDLSNTIKLLSLAFLPDDNLYPVYIGQPYLFDKLDLVETRQQIADISPTGFERNLITLVKNAQSNEVQVALFSFILPTLKHITSKDPYTGRLGEIIPDALEKNRVVMRSISRKNAITYFEASPSQLQDDLYLDWCHLNKEGQQAKARLFSDVLKNEGLIPVAGPENIN